MIIELHQFVGFIINFLKQFNIENLKIKKSVLIETLSVTKEHSLCLWATKKIFIAVYLRLTAHKKTFSYLVPFAFLMPFQMLSQYKRQFLFL